MSQPLLVRVHWLDALMEGGGWHSKDDAAGLTPRNCYTVGWLLKDDDQCVVLAHTIGDEDEDTDDVGGPICVPKHMLVSVHELQVQGDMDAPVSPVLPVKKGGPDIYAVDAVMQSSVYGVIPEGQ